MSPNGHREHSPARDSPSVPSSHVGPSARRREPFPTGSKRRLDTVSAWPWGRLFSAGVVFGHRWRPATRIFGKWNLSALDAGQRVKGGNLSRERLPGPKGGKAVGAQRIRVGKVGCRADMGRRPPVASATQFYIACRDFFMPSGQGSPLTAHSCVTFSGQAASGGQAQGIASGCKPDCERKVISKT